LDLGARGEAIFLSVQLDRARDSLGAEEGPVDEPEKL
jgi:hypothetical protein